MSRHINNHSSKRILCNKLINGLPCKYGKECTYAHNFDEQIIDKDRQLVYDIIDKKLDCACYCPIKNKNIYEIFKIMCKVCKQCCEKKCSGWKNCRKGAISQSYRICSDDFLTGRCRIKNCKRIHLTLQNLKPLENDIEIDFDYEITKKTIAYFNNIFRLEPKNIDNPFMYDSSDSDTEDEIKRAKKFINS